MNAKPSSDSRKPTIAIIGAGPAGLIAAEVLARGGCAVTLYERMASPARKFLIAGRGGLNLTHSEPRETFLARYGAAAEWLAPMIDAFPPGRLQGWAEGLGIATFIGSSGRLFPESFKASPLLRAWLGWLDGLGVRLAARHHWLGWDAAGALRFATPEGEEAITVDATLLALGGASWPRLGSDGGWVPRLRGLGVEVAALRPANSGALIGWSDMFRSRFAGEPLKRIALTVDGATVRGEAMIDPSGLEGGAVYALSGRLRDVVARDGRAILTLDLRPDLSLERLAERLGASRKGESLANRLRKAAGLSPAAAGLLREGAGASGALPSDPAGLAALIKHLPLTVTGMAGLERAISSAGGVSRDELTEGLELRVRPGLFLAGEMLDWEAPTGGYLLQACFATGVAAAKGVLARLGRETPDIWSGEWCARPRERAEARDDG